MAFDTQLATPIVPIFQGSSLEQIYIFLQSLWPQAPHYIVLSIPIIIVLQASLYQPILFFKTSQQRTAYYSLAFYISFFPSSASCALISTNNFIQYSTLQIHDQASMIIRVNLRYSANQSHQTVLNI